MLDLSILTPTGGFPDVAVQAAIAELGGRETANTLGSTDRIRELRYATGPMGPSIRYLMEPELEIPCLLLEGPGHRDTALRLADMLDCITSQDAALSYTEDAEDSVKVTLLRILSAHALQELTDPIASAALLAARDPSPFVRLGVVQLAQYANHPTIDRIVAEVVMPDPDPDVQGFAETVLESHA
jgi:hypothetical protein